MASRFFFGKGTYTPIHDQDFTAVLDQLSRAQSTEYKSTGRNIFIAGAVPVEPSAETGPVKPAFRPTGPPVPIPPAPPTLSMTFFGYGQLPSGGPRRAFLQEGEEVHIVGEGET